MNKKLKSLIRTSDVSGMLLSLSGIVLGILLAVSDYHVAWEPALSLVLTTIFLHIYMSSDSRMLLAASVAGAILTAYLSFGRLLSLEALLLLLFSWFVIRLARGTSDTGRVADSFITCLLKGPIALFGAYFVCTHTFGFWLLLLPAFSMGVLCVAADGMEDGFGKNMTAALVVLGLALISAYSFMRILHPAHFIYAVMIPVFLFYIYKMYKSEASVSYRPALAICTFALAVLTGLGFIGYLF